MLVNLTPHDLNVQTENGKVITIPRSGQIARCAQTEKQLDSIVDTEGLIPVCAVELGEVEGLPAPQEGTIFICSRIIAEAVKGQRSDVLVPGPAIRDEAGRVIGSKGLSRV